MNLLVRILGFVGVQENWSIVSDCSLELTSKNLSNLCRARKPRMDSKEASIAMIAVDNGKIDLSLAPTCSLASINAGAVCIKIL